jgi:hypothetical protein
MSIRLSEQHGVNPMVVQCFWCGNDRGDLALLGRLPGDKEAPHLGLLDYEPCTKCKEGMTQGITLIEVVTAANKFPEIQSGLWPTGHWWVITEEAAKRVFTLDEVLQKRKAFITPDLAVDLGLNDIVDTTEMKQAA